MSPLSNAFLFRTYLLQVNERRTKTKKTLHDIPCSTYFIASRAVVQKFSDEVNPLVTAAYMHNLEASGQR